MTVERPTSAAAFVAGLAMGLYLLFPVAAHASFQSTNCGTGNGDDSATQEKVSQAADYAYTAVLDGYQWGGGCWLNDDIDATPSDPEETFSGGEGPDCSGLVFKTWELNADRNSAPITNGWTSWAQTNNVHGPADASAFRSSGASWTAETKSWVTKMDALASTSHVAMYWSHTSSGSDKFIEAKGEDKGTQIAVENYLGSSSFLPSARNNWLPECSPQCL